MSRRHLLHKMNYYMVTDAILSQKGILHDVREAVRAGCCIVQYREKDKTTRCMIEEATALQSICGDSVLFLINDRVDVSLAVGSDGVHLGADDMPIEIARSLLGNERIIGLTVHNVDEAIIAERKGADYIGLSPIFETRTKRDAGKGCGVSMIMAVRNAVSLPIVVIGGINKTNAAACIEAGADAVCAISAVVCAEDIYTEVRDFIVFVENARRA